VVHYCWLDSHIVVDFLQEKRGISSPVLMLNLRPDVNIQHYGDIQRSTGREAFEVKLRLVFDEIDSKILYL
jgi:hypothetical protein